MSHSKTEPINHSYFPKTVSALTGLWGVDLHENALCGMDQGNGAFIKGRCSPFIILKTAEFSTRSSSKWVGFVIMVDMQGR